MAAAFNNAVTSKNQFHTKTSAMKKNYLFRVMLVLLPAAALFLSACKGGDAKIKEAITAAQKTNTDLAALTTDVKDGVVTLTGSLRNDDAKASVDAMVKNIEGVKQVIDNATVTPPPPPPPAPVVIAADDPLTKEVADATKDYPTVKTEVKDGVITLTGDIKRASLTKLMMTLHTLHPKKIDNQLTIK